MSGLYTKVNGQFVLVQANIKYNNQWRDTYQIYRKNNNTWQEVYNYQYITSEWSNCSVTCGGGIQTRSTQCKRSDNIIKDNNYCRKYGLIEPETSRTCNTQSCDPCAGITTALKYSRPFNDDVNQGKNGTTTWTFDVEKSGRYNVRLCLYVQAPTSGKSGNSKCANFIGVCVNATRRCPGDCTYNSGDGMVELPVNNIRILTSAIINIVSTSPRIAHISFNLGEHQLHAGQNYYSVTTNTHTDTSTAVYGIFNTPTNGITLQLLD